MYYFEDLGYKYPSRSDEHMLVVKKLRDTSFDVSYPYYDKRFFYRFKRFWFWVCYNLIVVPVCTLAHGLRIKGKENIKKNKALFKNGAITISNHVFMWDYLCVLKAIRPHISYFPAWKTNFEGPNGPLIRWAGGIPIPTHDFRAMVKFKKAMEQIFKENKWVHFFPEGSMWNYYPDIRPLKKAVFKFAVEYNRPIIPISLSFRKRRGIFKLFFNKPCVDLTIGEPLVPNMELEKTERITDLHKRAYHALQVNAGIDENHPSYNTNQNIEEYKSRH